MANIFVSYSRKSKEIAAALVNDIELLGHIVWYDEDLSGGQEWWDQILARIRGCDIFIFILDPSALSSIACKREYSYAADLCKTILPVLVSKEVSVTILPPALAQVQFVDYRQADRQAALRLSRAFTTVPASKPLPNPLPHPPEIPVSYLGKLAAQLEAPSLSYQEQSTLMVDLKRSFRNVEVVSDVRVLLEKLRERPDLFATVADEIDELLRGPTQVPSMSPHFAVQEPQRLGESSLPEGSRSHTSAVHSTTWNQRLRGATIGFGLGILWGWIWTSGDSTPDIPVLISANGIAGAITGLISGPSKKVIVSACVGLVLGLGGSYSVGLFNRDVGALIVGAPVGALVGAIIGAIFSWEEKGNLKNPDFEIQ